MPRPLRMEYEHAYYHVMNRGRGRIAIFHNKEYYQAFLETLAEASTRFEAILHAYCLMRNHYHLLIETPQANLGRIMRHINGIYTQRHNRLKKTDGPLFRGRYKAILVDADAYLLPLSRYIHRNPMDMQGCTLTRLENYPWSSYPAYVGKAACPGWLTRTQTYHMLGHTPRFAGYRNYVAQGIDEDMKRFYGKGNMAAVLGDTLFRERVREEVEIEDEAVLDKVLRDRPTVDETITQVAREYGVPRQRIRERMKGRRPANFPRKVAMYLCQHVGDISLHDIAGAFQVTTGGVSRAIYDVKMALEGKVGKPVKGLIRRFELKQ